MQGGFSTGEVDCVLYSKWVDTVNNVCQSLKGHIEEGNMIYNVEDLYIIFHLIYLRM